MFGRAIGRAGKQSYGRATWPGGRAGQRQTMACLMRLSAVRMLSRGRATAPRGDDARILGRRQRHITPMWLHISHSLRARGLFEAGWTHRRRSAENKAIAPKCRVGTMLTYLAEKNVTRAPVRELKSLFGACNELLDPAGRAGVDRPSHVHIGLHMWIVRQHIQHVVANDRC